MGDRSTPVTRIYLGLTSHLGQLSLAIPPCVGGPGNTNQTVVILGSRGVKVDRGRDGQAELT